MTLKVRLATMMVLVLLAVVALQYLLMERDRRALLSRLDELGSGLDEATALFVAETHQALRSPGPVDVDAFLRAVLAETDTVPGRRSIELFVWADTTHAAARGARRGGRADLEPHSVVARFPGADARDSTADDPGAGHIETERVETIVYRNTGDRSPGGPLGDSLLLVFQTFAETLRFEGRPGSIHAAFETWTSREPPGSGAHDIRRIRARDPWPMASRPPGDVVVNLPVPSHGDSAYAIQVRLPTTDLAEELDRSRRNGLLWLAAVLGVGVVGTVLVAGQFTRPIRTLEDSFGQVVQGNLDLTVPAPRKDEMGRLTHSFNHMVERLRQSRAVEDRLHEAERLASIGRLAAGVAHEVRNPLNAILLTMQQMRDRLGTRLDGDDDRRDFAKYYGVVTSELQRLEALVSAFLDLSKSGAIERRRVDVAETLRVSAELFRSQAEESGLHFETQIPQALPMDGDPTRLPMVWNNLLANALAAARSRVVMRAHLAESGQEVRITVEDDGPGIPEAQRSQVWEPFFSGRPGGTGLGLSIVRSVVEQHGGDVMLRSSDGSDSFTALEVRLPRFTSAPPEAGSPVAAASASASRLPGWTDRSCEKDT